MKTVKEVAKLTGISIRTLRYYDEIGLLKPTKLSAAGYRLYDERALEKLQEIMFFKELDLSLPVIRQMLDHPECDRQEVLRLQKILLEKKRNRLNGIIELIDDVMKGVNRMNFEAFNEDDIAKIVEHTVSRMKPEELEKLSEKFGGIDGVRAELTENLKDQELESTLIRLYGGKEKAIEVSLAADGDAEVLAGYQGEADAIYRQFAEAMEKGDERQKEDAVRRLAENSKAMFHFENARFFLLQLASELSNNPMLAKANDDQYGEGVSQYMACAIREYYGE